MTNRSPNGKRKTEVVNQEVVGGKISVLPRETLLTYQRDKSLKGMVEKGLERESDDVIVGVKAEGLKRFIVRIVMFKIIHEPEIRWTGKVGT